MSLCIRNMSAIKMGREYYQPASGVGAKSAFIISDGLTGLSFSTLSTIAQPWSIELLKVLIAAHARAPSKFLIPQKCMSSMVTHA